MNARMGYVLILIPEQCHLVRTVKITVGRLFVNLGHESCTCETHIDMFKSPLGVEFILTVDVRTVVLVTTTANKVIYLDSRKLRSAMNFKLFILMRFLTN